MAQSTTAKSAGRFRQRQLDRRRLLVSGRDLCAAVTVEPTYALYSLAETMSKFLYQAFLVHKVTYANAVQEPPLSPAYRVKDENAAKYVAFVNSWVVTPAVLATAVYTTLAMSWSDRAGKRRRPLIFIPLVGLLLECAFGAIHSYFWHWPVHWALATYALAQVACGGRICFTQTVYLYLADITSKENRTARYGALMVVRFFVLPLAYAFGGFLLDRVGFFYSFLISFALTLGATVAGCLFIGDTSLPVAHEQPFCHMINPKHSVQSIRTLFKKRTRNTRAILVMMLLAYSLYSITNEGEYSVMFLYFSHRFDWRESQIAEYLAYKLFGVGVGTLICSTVLSKCFKMEDGSIGIFIAVAKTIAAVCYVFAYQNWQLYVIPIIDMYFAAGITVTRSFATKLVASDELGRLAAVISLTKISVPLSQLLYNLTFAYTMHWFASSFFLISVFFALIILILTSFSHSLYRKQNSKISDEALVR